MTRGYLAIGGAVVLAAALGLYIMLGAGGDPASDPPVRSDRDQKTAADPGKPRIAPTPPRSPDGAAAPDRTVADRGIRDHRAGAHIDTEPPPPPPPSPPPPEGPRIQPRVTTALSQNLRPSLSECAVNLAPDTVGKKSRIEGQIVIAIKDHQATVTGASFELRDVAQAAQADIKRCLVEHAVGSTAPADGEADVEGYAIRVSLSWP